MACPITILTHKVMKPADWEERFAPEPRIKAEIERQIVAKMKS